jgi:hypothetical protein
MIPKDKNKECFILVPSCDAYSDAWDPFFAFFFKYWPDCPFPIYLISENKVFPDPRVTTITLKKDFGWANNVDMALKQVSGKYFIYFLEDVFLMKKVDTARILRLFEMLKRDNIACLRLYPSPEPDMPYAKGVNEGERLGVIAQNAPYRVSTMTAIWKKESFLNLMKAGENAWQMEWEGTKRSALGSELFLSVYEKNPAISYFSTAIKRGKWFYDAVQLCKKEGIYVDTSRRPVESKKKYLLRKINHFPPVYFLNRVIRKIKKRVIPVQ